MKFSNLFLAFSFALISFTLSAQQYMTRNGYVRFYSEAPIENIEAVNKQVSSLLNLENGEFAFLVPIKAFTFEKALMQEHFNENYLESGKFPTGSFKGKIQNLAEVDLKTDGSYAVIFAGIMSIHGVDRDLEEKATLQVKDGKLSLNSSFALRPTDYGVKIPASKKDNIADTLEISVKMDYDKK